MKHLERGFSLMEISVVLAVTAVLGLFAADTYRKHAEKRDLLAAAQYFSDLTAAVRTAALEDASYPTMPDGAEWARILRGEALSCAACRREYAVAPPDLPDYRITLETGRGSVFLQATPLSDARQTVLLMPAAGRALYCADQAQAQRQIQTASGCRTH